MALTREYNTDLKMLKGYFSRTSESRLVVTRRKAFKNWPTLFIKIWSMGAEIVNLNVFRSSRKCEVSRSTVIKGRTFKINLHFRFFFPVEAFTKSCKFKKSLFTHLKAIAFTRGNVRLGREAMVPVGKCPVGEIFQFR